MGTQSLTHRCLGDYLTGWVCGWQIPDEHVLKFDSFAGLGHKVKMREHNLLSHLESSLFWVLGFAPFKGCNPEFTCFALDYLAGRARGLQIQCERAPFNSQGRNAGYPTSPRTDLGVRYSRTGLLSDTSIRDQNKLKPFLRVALTLTETGVRWRSKKANCHLRTVTIKSFAKKWKIFS